MSGERRSWDEKITLALTELERRLQSQQNTGEMAENAWNKESGRDQRRESAAKADWAAGQKQTTDDLRSCSCNPGSCPVGCSGKYCGGRSADTEIVSKQDRKKKAFRRNLAAQVAKSAAFLLATIALIQGITRVLPDSITVSSSVGGRELPIYCVETDKKQVALSFDAAWGNEDTGRILEILKKNNVRVTFFMTGGWVESYPDDVKAILAAGHDLGNHSENHKNMSQLSDSECQDELMKVHTKVQELTGYEMFLFRPPYGDYDNHVITNAHQCGYYPIQWSIDSLDWKDYGAEDIVNRVVNSDKLKNGAIVLMHNGAKYTADALETVIKGLQDKGYELVPISELIYRDGYHMLGDGTQVSDK